MTRLSPEERYLVSLAQVIPPGTFGFISQTTAYSELKALSGEDFGYDVKAWEQWLDENIENWRFNSRPHETISIFQEILDIIDALLWAVGEAIKSLITGKKRL